MVIEEILKRFGENPVRQPNGGFMVRCPAHNDRDPSLGLAAGEQGRILLHCFAGCDTAAIVMALGLRMSDLFNDVDSDKQPDISVESPETQDVDNIPEKLIETYCVDLTQASREYLQNKRAISNIIIEKYKLGMKTTNSDSRWTIPIFDTKGRVVDVRLWLAPEDRTPKSAKIISWGQGYGGARLYPVDQLDNETLLFVEGELDALAAISAGFNAITLTTGANTLPTLKCMQLFDKKDVIILMDNDQVGKDGATKRAEVLVKYARSVGIATWPEEREEKWDITNELVTHGPESLRKIISAADTVPSTVYELPAPYLIREGRLGFERAQRRGKDGVENVFVPLSNFTARIIEDRILDDGAEVQRRYLLEGALSDGRRLPQIQVGAGQFTSLSFVSDQWGAKAIIEAGQATKDRLRHAIQLASRNTTLERSAYAHTGWRKIDGQWEYLHVGSSEREVVLEGKAKNYCLPEQAEDLVGAVAQSLTLLDLAPTSVTLPLLAAVYLAPLSEWLQPDFALWLVGRSGSRKSTLATLFLAHYGTFSDKAQLPGSWESTDNALEKLLFELKDVLVCIDDFAPRADSLQQRRQAGRAQRVIRQLGNSTGRGRLRADLSSRPDRPPRGLLVSTGEDLPPGQSVLARLLVINVENGTVDLPCLTTAQAKAGRLPEAFYGYIKWLKPQLNGNLIERLKAQFLELRNGFNASKSHGRIPETLAYLALGVELFLGYATESGALADHQVEKIRTDGYDVLHKLGLAHGKLVGEEDAAEIFISTIKDLLASHTVWLADKYSFNAIGSSGLIGWKDFEFAYLIPQVARAEVARLLQASGAHFPFTQRALYEALVARDALVKDSQGKNTISVKCGDKTQRVLKMPLRLFEEDWQS